MMHRKHILILTVILLLAVSAWALAANSLIDQRGVLTGKVAAQGLTFPGAILKEGEVLVYVDTITGPVPAARATVDCRVREVLVRPGDAIQSGDVLVRVEALGK